MEYEENKKEYKEKLFVIGFLIVLVLFILLSLSIPQKAIAQVSDQPEEINEGSTDRVSINPISDGREVNITPELRETWVIEKTGAEENLDVKMVRINDTASRVDIGFLDKAKYVDDTSKEVSRDIKDFPVTKLSADSFELSNTKVDLETIKENEVTSILITYPKFMEGMSFKLGWESVVITATNTAQALRSTNRNVVWINETTSYLFYLEGVGSVLTYLKTTNGGQTWPTAVPISFEVIYMYSIWYDKWTSEESGDLIHIIYVASQIDDMFYVSFNTTSEEFSPEITLLAGSTASETNGDQLVSVVRAKDGMIYAGGTIDSGTENWFGNSTNTTTWTSLNSTFMEADDRILFSPCNEKNPRDICTIYWDMSANQITIKSYNSTNNVWIESASVGNFADSNQVYTMDATYRQSDNHTILGAWTAYNTLATPDPAIQIWDITNHTTFEQKTSAFARDSNSGGVGLLIDQNTDNLYVAYTEGSTTSSVVNYKNSTDGGTTWTDAVLYDAPNDDIKGVYVGTSIGASGGRFEPIFYNEDTTNLYNNYTTSFLIPKAVTPSCTYSGSGNWNVVCSDNCVLNEDEVIDGNLTIDNSAGRFTINSELSLTGTVKKLRGDNSCLLVVNNGAGGEGGICYQEFANQTTECGGLDTGNYFTEGGWNTDASLTYDGSYSTSDFATGTDGYIYTNYSKPDGALNTSYWTVKVGTGVGETSNISLTLTQDCFDQNPIALRVRSLLSISQSNQEYCWDGSTWESLRSATGSGQAIVYEEAMYWNISSGTSGGRLIIL